MLSHVSQPSASGATCYRQQRSNLVLGIVCSICFVTAALGFAIMALLNPDGSFKYPVPTAILCFCFFGSIAAGSIWLTLTGLKYRLTLTETALEQTGVIHSDVVEYECINNAAWHIRPSSGKLQLACPHGEFTIRFDTFDESDRKEIIQLLRDRIPSTVQRGWQDFCERYAVPNPERERVQIRGGQILSLAILAFAVFFAIAGFIGLGVQYYACSVLNLATLVWTCRRKPRQSSHSVT